MLRYWGGRQVSSPETTAVGSLAKREGKLHIDHNSGVTGLQSNAINIS